MQHAGDKYETIVDHVGDHGLSGIMEQISEVLDAATRTGFAWHRTGTKGELL
jgi:hypothetical protein